MRTVLPLRSMIQGRRDHYRTSGVVRPLRLASCGRLPCRRAGSYVLPPAAAVASLTGATMASVRATNGELTVRAHRGDAKTLLAFNLSKARARRLAGFTIQVRPEGQAPYFLLNDLQFRKPADQNLHGVDRKLFA